MIDDPELQSLVNIAMDVMTLQAMAIYLQNHDMRSEELDSILRTFDKLQQSVVESMSRRIVELALLKNP